MNIVGAKQKAFTLVELLIVIVVIAILAAITIVAYNGIQQRARDTALTSDLASVGKKVQMEIVVDSGGTAGILQRFHQIMPSRDTAWLVGDGAENFLTETQLRWNDVPGLPSIQISQGSTIEIAFQYGSAVTPEINQAMLNKNIFCLTGAAPNSSYDYKPMAGEPENYDKLLFFDSTFGSVVTMDQLVDAYQSGREIACTGHVVRWLENHP